MKPFNYTPDPAKPRPWWKYTILTASYFENGEWVDQSVYAIIDKNETDCNHGLPVGVPEATWPYEYPRGRRKRSIEKRQEAVRAEIGDYLRKLNEADDAVFGPRYPAMQDYINNLEVTK